MRKILLVLTLLSLAVAAVAVSTSSDESSAAICDDVNVYILNLDGTYGKSVVGGVQSVKEAVDKALEDQGRSMKLNLTRTSILSVDDRRPGDGEYWRVFQWLPVGNSGWGVQAFNTASNDRMMSGTTYCVTISSISNVNGTNVYSVPDFEPVSKGYVFIRFANGFSLDNEHVKGVFTPEIRAEGFWIEGEGSTMGEVLKDAVNRNWPGEIETFTGNDGVGNNISDWIVTMFGLGNENLGDSTWAFWNQFCWVDHRWSFNDWTLGYYDPAVYPYMECIYLISTPDPYGDGYLTDKGGPDPNPDADAIVPMKNAITVDFRLEDGTLWSTQTVRFGESADMKGVGEPSLLGKGFVGWGDVTVPVTEDTVFTASFVDVTPDMRCIAYLTESGQLIRKEYVMPGSSPTYDGVPVKPSTPEFDYVFTGWDEDTAGATGDIETRPVFAAMIRSYEVRFFDYDRSLIGVCVAEYGSAADLPPDPVRDPTARYQFRFVGWSITPNNYVAVDLDSITDLTYAYAYFEPAARQYELTFVEEGSVVCTMSAGYGSAIGGAVPMDIFPGVALAKMYRDPAMTEEYDANYIVVGDTTIHVSRIAGAYDAPRDGGGRMSGDSVTVSFTEGLACDAAIRDGRVVVCDLSQYPNSTAASIARASLEALAAVHGGDAEAVIIVPRGSISMSLSSLLAVCGDGDELTFSIQNGPFNVKISSALKKIDYSGFYRVNLRVDGSSVTDLDRLGLEAELSLLLEAGDGASANVWNIASSGATTRIPAGFDGRFATFSASLMQFYAVGGEGGASARQTVVCPYGEAECETEGSGIEGSAVLTSMALDNLGNTLFIPSSLDGCTLKRISAGALNGVVNAPIVVVPVTVEGFSWLVWSNQSIRDVYFLGDAPDFEGSIPAGVTVHHRPDAEGWEVGEDDLDLYTYNGSYRKDTFSFLFYIVGGEAVVHRYISGPYVQVPDSVSVGGTSYPVTQIGDGAFMFSRDAAVKKLYGLVFEDPYNMETLELNSHIKGVQARALHGSTIVNLYLSDSVAYIWDQAFAGCGSLSNVSFSDELVFIGAGAFAGCDGKAFTRFTVPDSVRMMGVGAFSGCASISNVSLGSGIGSIPAECFADCGRLTDISIPSSVRTIGDRAFLNCSGLLFADLNGVESAGEEAFLCRDVPSAMEFVVFGENLVFLGERAFGNCVNIAEIEVHCRYFDSFDSAMSDVDLDKVAVFATDDVLSSWSQFDVRHLIEPEPQKDQTLLLAVEIGLCVFFAIVFVLSFARKTRVGA